MNSVEVSAKYQIVIPRNIRQSINLRPGESLNVFSLDGCIELVRSRPIREMRGRFKGIVTRVERDTDRS